MKQIQVGIIGGGIVGAGVAKICATHTEDIQTRLGAHVSIRRIAVRDLEKQRDPSLSGIPLTDDANTLIDDPDIHIIVEVMGGVETAFKLVKRALESGKHVVTANKALLAERGVELFETARTHGVDLAFEASVGGGIPIIRSLREALASDQIIRLAGIINGTSNYIMSEMATGATSIEAVVKEAQDLGYAEADPSMDVDGVDAAQKLSILTSLAFSTRVPFNSIPTTGLRNLLPVDFALAKHFGCVLKPIAMAHRENDGIYAAVTPALIPEKALLGSVDGAFNAIFMEGRALGPSLLYGQGAGMLPTAVSVVSDVIEVGRNILLERHGRLPLPGLTEDKMHFHTSCTSPFFLRLRVKDTPGVLAEIAGNLAHHKMSIRQMIQTKGVEPGEATIGLTTYPADEQTLRGLLKALEDHQGEVKHALALPIVTLS